MAEKEGTSAYLIDDPGDVDPAWLEERDVVGITTSASAPEIRVR